METNTSDLENDIKKITSYLDKENDARENVIRLSRDIIRLSKEIIKDIFLKEYKKASEKLRDILKLKDDIIKGAKNFNEISSGIINNALVEFVEATTLYNIFINHKVPTLNDLKVTYSSYLIGLIDAASELRRFILEDLRKRDINHAEKYLEIMEKLYLLICPLTYPDALLPGFRRKCDSVRRLIDDTKAILILIKDKKTLTQ